ncbi:3-oxo-tetronate kinase [Neorhodopirellula lusitana]|uniref:3-oxo-tetronate kinase n=1 Tax=Neorhodopirellula lusitana TaxID=445327 RepID=UPI00384FB75E
MNVERIGCIADDYTGATDLSSMLVRAGLRVVQCFGIPEDYDALQFADADAIVVSLKSRSIAAKDAVEESLAALRFLQSAGVNRFFFKYCSTFDSTAAGNIGPVADAIADALDVDTLFFCPSFPENGRTVYCGHLFVNGMPLHESGMRNHPLNPMTDSNLVRILKTQSRRDVAWLASGQAPSTPSPTHYIVDAINDNDLRKAAELAKSHVFLTGGSAIARYWVEAIGLGNAGLQTSRDDTKAADADQTSTSPGRLSVILAGSCSDATRAQVAEFERSHPVLHLNVDGSQTVEQMTSEAIQWCAQHWSNNADTHTRQPVLICSSASPASVAAARQQLGEREAAEFTEAVFAAIAHELPQHGVTRIVVAGGETSGAVINALNITAVRIGNEIAPGVPWVTTASSHTSSTPLSLALKSGNFGGPRFFFDALETQS